MTWMTFIISLIKLSIWKCHFEVFALRPRVRIVSNRFSTTMRKWVCRKWRFRRWVHNYIVTIEGTNNWETCNGEAHQRRHTSNAALQIWDGKLFCLHVQDFGSNCSRANWAVNKVRLGHKRNCTCNYHCTPLACYKCLISHTSVPIKNRQCAIERYIKVNDLEVRRSSILEEQKERGFRRVLSEPKVLTTDPLVSAKLEWFNATMFKSHRR